LAFSRWPRRLAIALLCFGLTCKAEQRIETGPYDIYYTAFPSMLVPAETAQQHKITRSPNRILLNIAVRNDETPTQVGITGTSLNLLNQSQTLNFAEIKEQSAIYYLAEVINHEQDTLRFSITIEFPTDHPSYELTFQRQYY
jgi:hypothetical protein